MSLIAEIKNKNDTINIVRQVCDNSIFGDTIANNPISIGTLFGKHLKSGKHNTTVNKALLRLTQAIGETVSATHITWLPAQQTTGFGHFSDAVIDYVEGSPIPILVQIAISREENGHFQTRGPNYFAGQEIALVAPTNMADNDAIKHLVRIIHDISVNGRIDNKLDVGEFEQGEVISYHSSPNFSNL